MQLTASVGGDPKGVLKTSANLEAAAEAIRKTLDATAADRILCSLPLHASYGFDFGLLTSLANGATLFLEDEVSPKRIAKLLREQRIDLFAGTPALFGSLVRVPTVKPLKNSGARFLSSGSALPASIAETLPAEVRRPPALLLPQTQAGPAGHRSRRQGPGERRAHVRGGRAAHRRPEGRPARRPNETGPIWVRSRALSTVSVPKIHLPKRGDGIPIGGLDEGWLRTGDLGQQDKAGRTVITGREDDLVKVDGKRVALGEVAGCLEAFPKVKAAAGPRSSPTIWAARWSSRASSAPAICRAEDIIDHCARNLAPYKVPRQIEFCEVI